jgi:hypothetical protein
MSPAMTATSEQNGDRAAPRPRPYPSTDVLRSLPREIVVDWQLSTDADRKN